MDHSIYELHAILKFLHIFNEFQSQINFISKVIYIFY